MESLSAWFEKNLFTAKNISDDSPQNKPYVITVIGSGGKTSLIWRLAKNSSLQKILVTPTTKMFVPQKEARLYDYYFGGGTADIHSIANPAPGVTLAGNFNSETGKLEALPGNVLKKITGNYDGVLVEGDGSRGLPLKAWAEHEPVVPAFTDITVGIIPIWPLGREVSEQIIFRLPEFCALSGAKKGEVLDAKYLIKIISGDKGLFAKAVGKKILFINQVENRETLDTARELAALLPGEFRTALYALAAGSVQQGTIREL
jgi:probable selenium-dependent hydroxylase accessory protein YqeC